MAKLLTKADIFKVEDIKSERVAVPEWGGEVIVRGLTGTERDEFEQSIMGQKGTINLANTRARLVVYSVIDEDGKRLFEDWDVKALGQKSAAALDRVVSVAMRLSGISDTDMEDLTGNSGATAEPGDGSPSA